MNITCDDKHIYRVDGKIVPGVTEILSSEGIINLRKIPISVLEPARKLGTEVHKITELWDRQKLDIKKVDPVIVPYLTGWLKFLAEMKPEFLEIEEMIYSKMYDVCGRPDRICLINGRLNLLDIKSTTTIMPSVHVQTGGYKKVWEEYCKKKIFRRAIVWLKPDGSYRFLPELKYIDEMRAISAFMLYNYKKENGYLDEADYTKELFMGGI